ncbi:hypothetical protein BH23GEM11_BH23GEM11_15620 [soil metagenome]
MRMPALRALAGAGVLLALGGPSAALEGQGAPPTPRLQAPAQVRIAPLALRSEAAGWLGVRVRYEMTETATGFPGGGFLPGGGRVAGPGGTTRTYDVRVEEVLPAGPARAAGMSPGDRLVEIDGVDAGQAIERGILAAVRPGQVVRFGVERNGRALRLDVVAAQRPASAGPASTPASVALARVRTDSIVTHMQLRMDSARVSVRSRMDPAAARALGAREAAGAREILALRAARPDAATDSRAWVVTRHGFPEEMSATTGDVRDRTSGASAQVLRGLVSGGAEGTAMRSPATAPRPIIVYATGQRAVLGAEVTPLNAGLAGYFGVDAGLLVTQVVDGAPGDRGGLSPGDVVVQVGPHRVSTIEEFRAAAEAGFRSPPLVLAVIREGRRLELRIPR